MRPSRSNFSTSRRIEDESGLAAAAGPSTMILLDPDLDPDPAPKATCGDSGRLRPAAKAKTERHWHALGAHAGALSCRGAGSRAAEGPGHGAADHRCGHRKLNRQFRGKNKATDVLSFPAEGLGAEGIAGDIAISVTTAMGQAARAGAFALDGNQGADPAWTAASGWVRS